VGASRGNHGQGLAWAGQMLGIPVAICVPRGNNPEKNEAMRGFGAEVIEQGDDYDAAVQVADRLVSERGMTLVHSTNHRQVIAGAGTLALEMLEQEPSLEVLVLSVGGGSQAVGAMTVARAMRPELRVFGVQAERAAVIHDSWHKRRPLTGYTANTFADGIANPRGVRAHLPGPARRSRRLRQGERGRHRGRRAVAPAHDAQPGGGAGATGLAGLLALRETLAGKSVGICISGGNIDQETLRRVVSREI